MKRLMTWFKKLWLKPDIKKKRIVVGIKTKF